MHCVSLSHLFRYFSLAQFLSFRMTITTLEFLKVTGQLFYRIFVIWIRLLFLHDSGYVSLAGISPE